MNLNIKPFLIEKLRFIHSLEEQQYTRHLLIVLAALGLFIGGGVYLIYNTCDNLHTEITKLQNSKKKARKLLIDFADIDTEETRLRSVLGNYANFNLKIYFEQFCKEYGFSAVPNWDTTTTAINPQIDEIALSATFKELTTESLVRMLQGFDKTEIVYVKNLRVKNEKDKKISCEITLATVKTKMG